MSSLYKDNYEDARHKLNYRIINHILSKKSRQSARRYASLMDWTSVLNSPNGHGVSNIITFQMLQATRVWINGNGILKAGLFVPRKDAVDQQEDKEVEREKKEASLRKNTLQLSTTPNKQTKRLKRSIKRTPVKSLAKITISPPKTNPPWSAYLHYTNIHDIPKTWREEVESEELIDLQQGMYLLAAFMYSQFKICNQPYLLFCKHLQLIGSKPAILALRVKQLWNIRVDHFCLLEVVRNNREWFKEDLLFLIDSVKTETPEKASCFGALVRQTEEERTASSGALYCGSTSSLSALEDQYQELTFIIYIPASKWTFPQKVIRSSKRLK